MAGAVKGSLALARQVKKLESYLKKLLGQNETPKRLARIAETKKEIAKLQATTAKGRTPPKPEEYVRPSRSEEMKRVAREVKGRSKKEIKEIIRLYKSQIDDMLKDADTTLTLTPAGEKLLKENTPASLAQILAKPEYYTRFSIHGKPLAKTGPKVKPRDRGEEVERLLRGENIAPHTQGQAREAMGGPRGSVSEKELERLGGFEIFNKGGYKKFQSRSKYGKKEHIYMGGGLVSEIPHFKPKKTSRKK